METFAITQQVIAHPLLALAAVLASLCIYTRITSGIAFARAQETAKASLSVIPIVPYWIPFLGDAIPFAADMAGLFSRLQNRYAGRPYALKVAGTTFNIVTSPSMSRDLFNNPRYPVDMEGLTSYILLNFFGDGGMWKKILKNPALATETWTGPHKALFGMSRDPFLTTAVDGLLKAVGRGVWNVVSGSGSIVDQEAWERNAKVQVVSGGKGFTGSGEGGDFVAEADLHVLLRDWVGHIATPLIMGRAFMQVNPGCLDDLFLVDSKINSFMLGLPFWLVPGLPPAVAARRRLLIAIEDWHDAMLKTLDGKEPGPEWDDLSDVPQLMWDRVTSLVPLSQKAAQDQRARDRGNAASNLAILWAMNVNANQIVFWLVFHLFADPKLLNAVRTELQPYVRLVKVDSGLPVSETPKLEMDIQALLHKCPLFKGSLYETMRVDTGPKGFKSVKEDFVFPKQFEGQASSDKGSDEFYSVKKGDMICIPMEVHDHDDVYWPAPDDFDPKRFWTEIVDEQGQKSIKVEYKTMQPWGGGRTMCKGRNFAEREVLIFAAAIVMTWNLELADKNGIDTKTGKWKHPGRIPTAGANVPKKNVRVRMSRRMSMGPGAA